MSITYYKRPTRHMPLTGVFNGDHDFIELTEWSNSEGYDIQTHEKGLGLQHISLSDQTIEALIHLYTASRTREQAKEAGDE